MVKSASLSSGPYMPAHHWFRLPYLLPLLPISAPLIGHDNAACHESWPQCPSKRPPVPGKCHGRPRQSRQNRAPKRSSSLIFIEVHCCIAGGWCSTQNRCLSSNAQLRTASAPLVSNCFSGPGLVYFQVFRVQEQLLRFFLDLCTAKFGKLISN